MALSPFSQTILIWLLAFLVGIFVHEFGHYLFGTVFGGGPFVSEYRFGVPVRIDFESPQRMSDWQVRIVGGVNIIWLFLLLFLISTNTFSTYSEVETILLAFLA
jgi:hypothetical protein